MHTSSTALKFPLVYSSIGLRIVPLLPGTKRPYRSQTADIETGWSVIFLDTPESWISFRETHPHCNVSLYWCGCQVDMDSPAAIEWVRSRGISLSNHNWVLKTARGYRVFYASPKDCPPTYIDSSHTIPDLIGPGRLAVVPPSLHPSGFLYRWVEGHSPLNHSPNELATPPSEILQEWIALKKPPVGHRYQNRAAPTWLGLVFEEILAYLEKQGSVLLQRPNGSVLATCPLHDDRNPSLSIHPDRGWKCFAGCGEGRLTSLAALLGLRVNQGAKNE